MTHNFNIEKPEYMEYLDGKRFMLKRDIKDVYRVGDCIILHEYISKNMMIDNTVQSSGIRTGNNVMYYIKYMENDFNQGLRRSYVILGW